MPLAHIENILSRLADVKPAGKGYDARCPAHDDGKASLSVNVGKNDRALVHCHAGCATHAIMTSIGLRLRDLFPPDSKAKIVATYDYVDEQGVLLYQICRFQPKDFKQRRPADDGWIWNLSGVRRVLYRLPELITSTGTVFIVEGEKDADNGRKLGLTVTTSVGGASKSDKSKWLSAYNTHFAGRDVVVVGDNDTAGQTHAYAVAKALHSIARTVCIITLPGNGKDLSDWIAAGGTAEQLSALAAAAPAFDPTYTPPRDKPSKPSESVASDNNNMGHINGDDPHVALGQRDPATDRLILSAKRTVPTAEAYVREFHTHEDGQTLTTYSGVPFIWRNNRHEPIEQAAIEQRLYPWLHNSLRYILNRQTNALELVDFEANPSTVKAALQTILSHTYLAGDVEPPVWHPADDTQVAADELLVCRSESVHLPTGDVIPATPRLFVTASLDFDYDADAPDPVRWLDFLNQVFSGDQHSVFLLQQWFGYCLTMDTRQQKMLLMIGPKRSGKGTVARVLKQLIGTGNVAGPTVGSLAGPFGLQPLIGKSLAIVSDARFAGDGVSSVVERLLCISGEDTLTIDRKFLPSVTMKLPTRFCFLTNEPPRLSDASGALAGRFMVLRYPNSFFGREDITLTTKLTAELPGILKWAIEGWHMVRVNSRFIEPESSAELVEEMQDSMSPIGAFVRDKCRLGPEERVWVKTIYDAWKDWCKEQGRDHAGTIQSFSRDLRASVSHLQVHKDENDTRFYSGICLKVGA